MNATATTHTVSTFNIDNVVFPREYSRRGLHVVKPDSSDLEKDFNNQILESGNGKSLLRFCRELSSTIVREYMGEDNAEELRSNLCTSLSKTLACSAHEAQCLVDLAIELIHVKIHQEYRCSNIDHKYLIQMANQAISHGMIQ